MRWWFLFPVLTFSVLLPFPAAHAGDAEADDPDIETVYVWGRREPEIGQARSASEGTVSYASFSDRPLLRTGELAEVVPGLAVTQHSGTGKANQYFLRGFNLDHGTDFSVSLDGVPLNLRSNAHGQGYLDLNVMIPELVGMIHYRKGPYYAELGDFSLAGAAAFDSFASPPEAYASAAIGENGYGRLLWVQPAGNTYLAADITVSDGPWQNDENLRKGNFLLRHQAGDWSLTAMGYKARWNSTDQIPLRAVRDGSLDRLGTVDPTDGGETSRLILSARMQDADGLDAVLYLQRYTLDLFSNFTYFLDDPVNGDQFSQSERRWIGGGWLAKGWTLSPEWTLKAGGEFRYDLITDIGLYRTAARRILSTDRQDSVDQGSLGLWTEAQWRQGPLRATLGLRADGMGVEVDSDNPLNSGKAWDHVLSPKAGLAWTASDAVELYANAGRGYHSNDARGAVAHVAPVSGTPIDPVDLYAPGWGGEIGARYEVPGFSATASFWGLKLDSELVYVGDAGDTASSGSTKRLGVEVLFNWTPVRSLNFDFSAARTYARYVDAPGADRIPNALGYMLSGGASWAMTDDTLAQVTFRRLGPAPLVEDGSVHSEASTLVNLLLRHDLPFAMLSLEVLNVFDSRDEDITYYYASRLPGEPASGVDDLHVHPMEPRTLRLAVKVPF